jgi:hypothetical protein
MIFFKKNHQPHTTILQLLLSIVVDSHEKDHKENSIDFSFGLYPLWLNQKKG